MSRGMLRLILVAWTALAVYFCAVVANADAGRNTAIPAVLRDLGVMQVTSYRPVPEQTKPECTSRFHCTTSIDDGVTIYGVAVSQDMLARNGGPVNYGDILYVPGYGYRVVNDCMNKRHRKSIDLMVLTHEEEKRVGVRSLPVFVLRRGR